MMRREGKLVINGRITVTDIDYEESFRTLFPMLIGKARDTDNPGIAFRLLDKMGDDSLPIMLEIMEHMKEQDKEMLILSAIELFKSRIVQMINDYLKKSDAGRSIYVDGICAMRSSDADGLSLILTGVDIDYQMLANTDFAGRNIDEFAGKLGGKFGIERNGVLGGALKAAVRGGARIGASLAPNEIEKKGVELLNAGEYNAKLIEVVRETLRKAGFFMSIKEISLIKVQQEIPQLDVIDSGQIDDESAARLTDTEEILLDAVVSYLKHHKPI